MSAEIALPTSGDDKAWTDSEKALVEAAGLVSRGRLAPRPVVEAFLSHCRRTQLDPIARQIYCIERGGKWTTQVSIDGARLVAERSRQYQGQTPVEWTADGVTWLQVWLSKDNPAAARVGVYRAGFQAPLVAVARWDAYNAGSPIWKKMPDLMLGKCAEMLALRKAFPQDLSGLYSAEEMDQAAPATAVRAEVIAEAPERHAVPREPSQDWLGMAAKARSRTELRPIFEAARDAGELDIVVEDTEIGKVLWNLRDKLPEDAPADEGTPDPGSDTAEPVTEWPVVDIPKDES